MSLSRTVFAFVLFAAAATGFAQRGQGGAGGGFGGGQGGQGGRVGDPEDGQRRHLEDDPDQSLWSTRSAVLTPGDRVEYKFTVKKGDTLLAGVQSDIFDPAISVVDSKGKEIAKNDDREEGDQSPFVEAHFPSDGIYILKVLCFRSAAGGKFTIKLRTLSPVDAKLEPQTLETPPAEDRPRTTVRFSAEKGKIYDLWRVVDARPNGSPLPYLGLIGPTGVASNDFKAVRTPDGTPVIEALRDGEFYAEYFSQRAPQIKTDYRLVSVVPAKSNDTLSLNFAPHEVKIVELPVTPNLMVRTILKETGVRQMLDAPSESVSGSFSGDPTFGQRRGWVWFRTIAESDVDVTRVFQNKETARLTLRSSNESGPLAATLSNSESLPEWKPDTPIEGHMAIGESRLYVLDAGKAELMKASIKATQFLVKMNVYRFDGGEVFRLMSRTTNAPSADWYFSEASRFIVRVTCEGYGGSGDFTMNRQIAVATPYGLGTTQTIELDGRNFRLYSVDLQAGKRYQLVFDHPDVGLGIDFLDPNGQYVDHQSVTFDNVGVFYYLPKLSGPHRIWVHGQPGTWHIKLEPHASPTVGN